MATKRKPKSKSIVPIRSYLTDVKTTYLDDPPEKPEPAFRMESQLLITPEDEAKYAARKKQLAKQNRIAERNAKAAESRERFEALMEEIASMSEEDRNALAARMGRVINCEGKVLSVHNTLLVGMQRPGSTITGGYRQWLQQGRCVNKGEHGLKILAPSKGKSEDDGEECVKYFFPITVFDISQTSMRDE